ncbi:YbaK/EbsC family protein [Cellulomonas oligotrophica]|uniref:Proline--tRNA ligase n=1 Tax=Cellulomonas oligotrophica TaxID=931536 RepID=A0A7Y9FGK9_9CELL|nr:YbaK/EbsC family protein [Cellulomonas oligotrophica]NYD86963.1 prolyl-tRNA editing enzyme YbaK/EbsC (Cys-tRNA(Pro) deacylase) [Cellulomonas oligotrophica]GIG32251.1 proline--tRNA ligase [Cellulomonas oligotrophica]
MSLDLARAHLARFGRADDVIVTERSSATVELAAQALGVEPARIAKTLSFRGPEPGTALLVVVAGDARVDNAAFRAAFGVKARMLGGDEVEELTGHAPGGVCPFGNPPSATVRLDTSLQRFASVFPACGDAASAIELTCDELAHVTGDPGWVTVSRLP